MIKTSSMKDDLDLLLCQVISALSAAYSQRSKWCDSNRKISIFAKTHYIISGRISDPIPILNIRNQIQISP